MDILDAIFAVFNIAICNIELLILKLKHRNYRPIHNCRKNLITTMLYLQILDIESTCTWHAEQLASLCDMDDMRVDINR